MKSTETEAFLSLSRYYEVLYTKQEMAQVLALAQQEGILEPLPDATTVEAIAQQPRLRGRPKARLLEEDIDCLVAYLAEIQPRQVSRAMVAKAIGVGPKRLERMADALPSHIRSYWDGLPDIKQRVRLAPLVRHALDLHNYCLLLRNGGASAVSLYTLHAALRGPRALELAQSSERLLAFNAGERQRVLCSEFVSKVTAAGWLEVDMEKKTEPVETCEGNCPFLEGLWSTWGWTVGDVHLMLARHVPEGVPLRPNDETPITMNCGLEELL